MRINQEKGVRIVLDFFFFFLGSNKVQNGSKKGRKEEDEDSTNHDLKEDSSTSRLQYLICALFHPCFRRLFFSCIYYLLDSVS